MNNNKAPKLRKFIPPSIRSKLRDVDAWRREFFEKFCLWRWEIVSFVQSSKNPHNVIYVGRKELREMAKLFMQISEDAVALPNRVDISNLTAVISEAPFPGALRVPFSFHVIIPLGRPIDEIAAEFDDKLRRVLRNQIGGYRTQQALYEAEIEKADQDLLQPYAKARHGKSALQLSSTDIQRIAQESGRLDLVMLGDEVVGCILGSEARLAGKRYWSLIRCGYPDSVFSDAKRLREVNVINFYLALEWAVKNNFEYYDMGTCLAIPEDGLLQWKKRWGGLVQPANNYSYFYVRLPKFGAAQFLWSAPLFSIEKRKLILHLGLPEGKSDEDFSLRYREMHRGMGIAGLHKIYLHCTKLPSESLLEALRSHYSHQSSPPIVENIMSS